MSRLRLVIAILLSAWALAIAPAGQAMEAVACAVHAGGIEHEVPGHGDSHVDDGHATDPAGGNKLALPAFATTAEHRSARADSGLSTADRLASTAFFGSRPTALRSRGAGPPQRPPAA